MIGNVTLGFPELPKNKTPVYDGKAQNIWDRECMNIKSKVQSLRLWINSSPNLENPIPKSDESSRQLAALLLYNQL
jgi:hypothetical protein